jgi:hypothetical protein
MNPEMAKEMESRYIPNVGLASVPVTPEVRSKLQGHQQFDAALKDLKKFVTTHTTLVPGTPDYTTGQSMAMAVQAAAREGLLNTVYREGEQPILDKIIKSDNPAGIFKMLKTIPQIEALEHMNSRDFNVLRKSVGLKGGELKESKPVQSSQQALQWAKSNPNDPRAAEILKRLGQ